ncbi:MAG TPA: ammonium transporter [Pirellulales bacterium]
MAYRRVITLALVAMFGLLLAAGHLQAQGPAAQQPAAQQPAAAAPAATEHAPPPGLSLDKGDQAWMLVASALVLLMTAPGLALFYSGLVRKKNVLGVMMQCFFLMGLMTVLWALYGYSLSFGGAKGEATYSPWIGNGEYLFMQNVQPSYVEGSAGTPGSVVWPLEDTITKLAHMLFQGMFFIITPALICGAFAERMKFSTMVVFSIVWGTVVYCPLCHWVWDKGLLAAGSEFAWFGALDFAGGTVVHISSGVSALICALVMGKRLGFGHDPMPPHNLTYTVIGAAMLWVGWFGFNAGSALNAGGQAASAFAATHFAAAAATLAWPAAEWITRGKPTVLGACSGAVAGLVCITPASGYVQPMAALIMGLCAGLVCFFACTAVKSRFGYDDSLDAFGVHGVGGTLGAVLTGVFATRNVYDATGKGDRLGLLEGGSLLGPQIGAAVVTWVYAAVVTFIILKVLDAVMGLRVSQQDEVQGLDYSQHGEEGYIFL